MFLGTLRCHERVFVQAAAATSVSSPMEDERRTNSARPRIASARAAAAALARSSTNFVDAPSRTKLLRRSIMAGAPVERGVKGSELVVESMALTSSRARSEWLEFEACALPEWDSVEFRSLVSQLWARFECEQSHRCCYASQTLRRTVQTSCNLVTEAVGASDGALRWLPIIRGVEFVQLWDS